MHMIINEVWTKEHVLYCFIIDLPILYSYATFSFDSLDLNPDIMYMMCHTTKESDRISPLYSLFKNTVHFPYNSEHLLSSVWAWFWGV